MHVMKDPREFRSFLSTNRLVLYFPLFVSRNVIVIIFACAIKYRIYLFTFCGACVLKENFQVIFSVLVTKQQ